MICGLVYNPNDRKLLETSYSQTYRDMFLALQGRFETVRHITRSCSAQDIDADVIVFYDIHSTHDIVIDGIKNHNSVKYEYFNDPHQKDEDFTRDGITVHKMGFKERTARAVSRGVHYILCPSHDAFYKYIKPYGDVELVWFPIAPKQRLKEISPISIRKKAVLGNGCIWAGENGFRPYEFRSWAFNQSCINHEKKIVVGEKYQQWLSCYASALALCDTYVCPKYLEIPLSGCVCFAQKQLEYEDMGFRDGLNCIYVDKGNLQKVIKDFIDNISYYQSIADNGRKMAEKYTSEQFADFIYNHAKGQ